MFLTLKRIFLTGWRNFTRDGGPSFATIFIILIPVFLISFLFVFKDISQVLVSFVEDKAEISVYFKENTKDEDILYLKGELSKIPEVKEVRFIPKEQALQNFIQRHSQNPTLMEALREIGKNPFLPSLSIKAQQLDQYQRIIDFFESSNFRDEIEKIDYYERRPIIEKIFSLTRRVRKISFILFGLMVILALLISFNTIRLSIIKQKEEIKIQKLVGASNWFIRGPFFVQGLISGILSSLICFLIFGLGFYFLEKRMENFLPEFHPFLYFEEKALVLFLIQFLTGILIGVFSSFLAIGKYLKV